MPFRYLRLATTAAIAACIALYSATLIFTPRNYLVTDRVSPTLGWQVHGARVVQTDAEAPDGSRSALKVTATSGDGHLILQSLRTPSDRTATFSVYLRADPHVTIAVGVYATKYIPRTARLGPEWQRFTVTGDPGVGKRVNGLVGGGRTFLEGDTIYVWGPQLDFGTEAAPYRSYDVSQLSWIDRQFERLRLRTIAPWLLWVAAALSMALLGLSWRIPAVQHVRFGVGGFAVATLRQYRADRLRLRTLTVYVFIAIATLVLIELAAFTVSTVRTISAQQVSPLDAARSVYRRAAVLVSGSDPLAPQFVDQSTIFSPLTQIRRLPGDLLPPYHINRLGLVDNEGASPALDIMPEKPPGMVRIILYGGSTAMGIGAPNGSQTLTARLEKLLNRHARPGTVFQVLNFGHGGGQSFTDLTFMAAMGTYLDPDVSISLNGFNDAFFASESSFIFGSYGYVINWSDFSYYYHNTIGGLTSPRPVVLRLLPFVSLLYNDLRMTRYVESKSAKTFYDAMPMRLITQEFDRKNPLRDRLLLENLRFIAGYFVNRDQIFLSYLQPHPLQDRSLLTTAPAGPSEAVLVDQSIARLARHPADEYRRRMLALFDAYGANYRTLEREYAANGNIRFFDIRDELRGLPEAAYIDIIHYTVGAQQRLAERMFEDLKSFDAIRRGLAD